LFHKNLTNQLTHGTRGTHNGNTRIPSARHHLPSFSFKPSLNASVSGILKNQNFKLPNFQNFRGQRVGRNVPDMDSSDSLFNWKTRCPQEKRETDWAWMGRAIRLARNGLGLVEPNPLVGCVLVRDGHLVGEGWHDRFGGNHAEVNAILAAGAKAKGATAYVSLEPCCHQGKTGPCTAALIAAGVSRVVAGILDPFPQVSGKGLKLLRQHGIETLAGCRREEATETLQPYLHLLKTGRPWVIAKWAMTLDGKIASRTGASQWISCDASRRLVHQWRGQMDAILVGSGTVLADNPHLTARPSGPRIPTRVVLDRRGRMPLINNLAQTTRDAPVLVVTSEKSPPAWRADLERTGTEVLVIREEQGNFLESLMLNLGKRSWTNLFVEGGNEVLGALFDQDLIDELRVFVAPTLLGGGQAFSPLGGQGAKAPWIKWGDKDRSVQTVGTDVLIRSTRKNTDPLVDNLEIRR
jgi:diaminohydroxyphosphoribosylaminopyrimidine deaminase/5-amino-6-(5-phosphoribosylamino)uracil reductase